MKNQKREIETFELSTEYYIESFLNGNKNHVAEELSELMIRSFSNFQRITLELPKEMRVFVLNSKYYNDANIKLTGMIHKYL